MCIVEIYCLEKLEEANISLRTEKCLFGNNEIDHLGYHLSEEGIRLRKELVDNR